jgi:hypothetical protein
MLDVVIYVSIGAEWPEDHMSAIGFYTLNCRRFYVENFNLRPDGAIR